MLRGLRWQLTLLYLLAALALLALIGVGMYQLLSRYFETTTDLALQHKMAEQFRLLGAALPPELAEADRSWHASRGRPLPTTGISTDLRRNGEEHEGEGEDRRRSDDHLLEDAYDAELAAIFVLPLDARGQVLAVGGSPAAPLAPDAQAVAAALQRGSDWRTVRLADGTRLRLLTYALPGGTAPAVLQVGRALSDQDRLLHQLLIGLLGLGTASAVLMGLGSWWLAGRSLRPAQDAWERQQAFVANASHELRTPLTLIRASAEVAQRGLPAGDERRTLLDDILAECDHMGRLVEDLLLLSRLDAGRLKLERQRVALADLLTEIQRQVGRLADARGIHLVLDGASGAVWGDPTRLRQVLLILLDNALHYTPAGGSIRLAARPQGRYVVVTVTDTGSGIAPEHLPHIFERFYQADSARRSRGGSGLGLSIAKALIEAQHGQIRLESRPGEGTRVSLLLPAV